MPSYFKENLWIYKKTYKIGKSGAVLVEVCVLVRQGSRALSSQTPLVQQPQTASAESLIR